MDQLNFGSRKRLKARRRATFRRAAVTLWVLGLAGAALGFTTPTAGVDVVADFLDGRQYSGRGVATTDSAESAMKFRQGVFESRPVPKPSPTATPSEAAVQAAPEPEPVEVAPAAPSGSVEEIIYAAAAEFGLDGAYLVGVAACESGLNPGAVNAAGYHGLFQYDEATWGEYGYGSIYDPVAQSRTTAMLIAQGQSSRWPNCA